MFERAAPRWACPDEEALDRCAFLQDFRWVARTLPGMVAQRPWESAERDVPQGS